MTVIDVLLAVMLILGVIRGLVRGFLGEIVGILTLVTGGAAALLLAPFVAPVAPASVPTPVAYAGAFLIIFVVVQVLGRLLGGLLTRAADRTPLGPPNRILGGAVGLCKALAFGVVLIALVDRIPGMSGIMDRSRLVPAGRVLAGAASRGLAALRERTRPGPVAPLPKPAGERKTAGP